ncbi:MAG: Sulfite reductase [NADPH] flavoprotein alpha-component [Chlamydiae bacterium]|nr:Sulfite reductase [NADPH] flavoprotein alpha-component [Chlamydiota bacterium]
MGLTETTRKNPFPAKITERTLLNKEGSTKRTYHLTLDLTGSDISYKVGDSLGIFPENPSNQVKKLLNALKKTGQEEITDPRSGSQMTLEHFFTTKANLLRIPLNLHETPLQEILSSFAPLLPRFYSIASAPSRATHTVDLLIATFSYMHEESEQEGITSKFLTETAELHTTPIYIFHHPTPSFTLPTPETPILMIGPGTGVAPYRAFLQERERENAPGENWLIFGERNRTIDFYYESFFRSLQKKEFLRLDLAFSRDQKEKVYVQHKLLEKAPDIWQLIQSGGTVYICGDASRMAKDVTAALHTIAENQGNLSPLEAKHFIKKMRRDKRLLMDVY